MNVKGYEQLAAVLHAAYDQASKGKGAERHADSKPFHEQPMQTGSDLLGTDAGLAFQAIKKIREGSTFSEFDRFEREMLGAINYIAGMVIWRRRHQSDAPYEPVNVLDDGEAVSDTAWTCRTSAVAPESFDPASVTTLPAGVTRFDPDTWLSGDIVVRVSNKTPEVYTPGAQYMVRDRSFGQIEIYDNFGANSYCVHDTDDWLDEVHTPLFAFHRRPSAVAGGIKS